MKTLRLLPDFPHALRASEKVSQTCKAFRFLKLFFKKTQSLTRAWFCSGFRVHRRQPYPPPFAKFDILSVSIDLICMDTGGIKTEPLFVRVDLCDQINRFIVIIPVQTI